MKFLTHVVLMLMFCKHSYLYWCFQFIQMFSIYTDVFSLYWCFWYMPFSSQCLDFVLLFCLFKYKKINNWTFLIHLSFFFSKYFKGNQNQANFSIKTFVLKIKSPNFAIIGNMTIIAPSQVHLCFDI